MKHKVAELQGALLDAAVALAEGWSRMPYGEGWRAPRYMAGLDGSPPIDASTFEAVPWPWSTDWTYGGPLIERERIALEPPDRSLWKAVKPKKDGWSIEYGPTPLVAAMRAYAASRYGDEIDLP